MLSLQRVGFFLQSSGLEQIVISLALRISVVRRAGGGLLGETEATVLVDRSQLMDDVVVEPVKSDQESTRSRRLAQEPVLSKGILFEEAILESAHRVLLGLVVTVQRAEIEIGRTLHDGVIGVICAKYVVNDDGRKVE
jgi:hypothetical protein